MAGQHIHPFKDESPGHIGRLADNLGVHQVGKADATGGDRCGYGYHVQHIHIVHLGFAAVHPEGDNQSQRTAVTGKPFIAGKLPAAVRQELHGKYHFPEVIQVIIRLVEQTVPQSRSYQDAEEAVEEQRFECLFVDFPVVVLAVYYYVGKSDTYHP